jgi:hypothetical protein
LTYEFGPRSYGYIPIAVAAIDYRSSSSVFVGFRLYLLNSYSIWSPFKYGSSCRTEYKYIVNTTYSVVV